MRINKRRPFSLSFLTCPRTRFSASIIKEASFLCSGGKNMVGHFRLSSEKRKKKFIIEKSFFLFFDYRRLKIFLLVFAVSIARLLDSCRVGRVQVRTKKSRRNFPEGEKKSFRFVGFSTFSSALLSQGELVTNRPRIIHITNSQSINCL